MANLPKENNEFDQLTEEEQRYVDLCAFGYVYNRNKERIDLCEEKYKKDKKFCVLASGVIVASSLYTTIITQNPLYLSINSLLIPNILSFARTKSILNSLFKDASQGHLNYRRFKRIRKNGELDKYIKEGNKWFNELNESENQNSYGQRYRQEEIEEETNNSEMEL